jgi:hypothetical protein
MKRIDSYRQRGHKPSWPPAESLEFNRGKPNLPSPKEPNEELSKEAVKPMTQIVGIVYKESVNYTHRDAIVIACESQYTIGGGKLTDAQKMSMSSNLTAPTISIPPGRISACHFPF